MNKKGKFLIGFGILTLSCALIPTIVNSSNSSIIKTQTTKFKNFSLLKPKDSRLNDVVALRNKVFALASNIQYATFDSAFSALKNLNNDITNLLTPTKIASYKLIDSSTQFANDIDNLKGLYKQTQKTYNQLRYINNMYLTLRDFNISYSTNPYKGNQYKLVASNPGDPDDFVTLFGKFEDISLGYQKLTNGFNPYDNINNKKVFNFERFKSFFSSDDNIATQLTTTNALKYKNIINKFENIINQIDPKYDILKQHTQSLIPQLRSDQIFFDILPKKINIYLIEQFIKAVTIEQSTNKGLIQKINLYNLDLSDLEKRKLVNVEHIFKIMQFYNQQNVKFKSYIDTLLTQSQPDEKYEKNIPTHAKRMFAKPNDEMDYLNRSSLFKFKNNAFNNSYFIKNAIDSDGNYNAIKLVGESQDRFIFQDNIGWGQKSEQDWKEHFGFNKNLDLSFLQSIKPITHQMVNTNGKSIITNMQWPFALINTKRSDIAGYTQNYNIDKTLTDWKYDIESPSSLRLYATYFEIALQLNSDIVKNSFTNTKEVYNLSARNYILTNHLTKYFPNSNYEFLVYISSFIMLRYAPSKLITKLYTQDAFKDNKDGYGIHENFFVTWYSPDVLQASYDSYDKKIAFYIEQLENVRNHLQNALSLNTEQRKDLFELISLPVPIDLTEINKSIEIIKNAKPEIPYVKEIKRIFVEYQKLNITPTQTIIDKIKQLHDDLQKQIKQITFYVGKSFAIKKASDMLDKIQELKTKIKQNEGNSNKTELDDILKNIQIKIINQKMLPSQVIKTNIMILDHQNKVLDSSIAQTFILHPDDKSGKLEIELTLTRKNIKSSKSIIVTGFYKQLPQEENNNKNKLIDLLAGLKLSIKDNSKVPSEITKNDLIILDKNNNPLDSKLLSKLDLKADNKNGRLTVLVSLKDNNLEESKSFELIVNKIEKSTSKNNYIYLIVAGVAFGLLVILVVVLIIILRKNKTKFKENTI